MKSKLLPFLLLWLVGCAKPVTTMHTLTIHNLYHLPEWSEWITRSGTVCGLVYPQKGSWKAMALYDNSTNDWRYFPNEKAATVYIERFCKP